MKPNISSRKQEQLSLGTKSFIYTPSQNEIIQLIGVKHKRFLSDSWYIGESGYAAISPKRHGYIEGAIISGIQKKWGPFTSDFSIGIGPGGGGNNDVAEGSGLRYSGELTLGYQVINSWVINIDIGHVQFMNGQINTPYWGAYITYPFEIFKK